MKGSSILLALMACMLSIVFIPFPNLKDSTIEILAESLKQIMRRVWGTEESFMDDIIFSTHICRYLVIPACLILCVCISPAFLGLYLSICNKRPHIEATV